MLFFGRMHTRDVKVESREVIAQQQRLPSLVVCVCE